ncbi:hypothetical protein CC85DRAFT_75811 [Cutaneotrichosporon oleaginosum]|uniref:Uncharacterized protein n=1 Tax=Cutaneotrichosporon oleaginosum TaxID=879819 RepID=A0A0J0XP14_9TREE|nr:uncharacterized protein CC85DRAFT_75811 [Cutaneotrichosporon oleaginosum]KLT42840.1 hypothetical protein CC85DRAFT_75811 [Cutaneotrichosporon oleaginosum]TXT08194.1 hypothetical protein COLE_05118 [Cutaneotrichosporon oleaginosum]
MLPLLSPSLSSVPPPIRRPPTLQVSVSRQEAWELRRAGEQASRRSPSEPRPRDHHRPPNPDHRQDLPPPPHHHPRPSSSSFVLIFYINLSFLFLSAFLPYSSSPPPFPLLLSILTCSHRSPFCLFSSLSTTSSQPLPLFNLLHFPLVHQH